MRMCLKLAWKDKVIKINYNYFSIHTDITALEWFIVCDFADGPLWIKGIVHSKTVFSLFFSVEHKRWYFVEGLKWVAIDILFVLPIMDVDGYWFQTIFVWLFLYFWVNYTLKACGGNTVLDQSSKKFWEGEL